MPDRPPIPEPIWRALLAFLDAGKTGELRLLVEAGQVVDADLLERLGGRLGSVLGSNRHESGGPLAAR